MILELTPDWTDTWTKEQAEIELHPFVFKGEGLYLLKGGETLLVSEAHSSIYDHPAADKKYVFRYWGESPAATFNWLATAPVRVDER